MNGVCYYGTSYRPSTSPNYASSQLTNSPTWVPPAYLNNYMSIQFNSPQIIHYIQIKGNNFGYVTDYLLHYRNKDGSPLICWNSCQRVRGNTNGSEIS